MHLVFSCNLSNRLDAHQGFQPDLGLEGACIPFPLCFAHSSAVLSCPAEPEKSNLATGPNYGVHFCSPMRWLILSPIPTINIVTHGALSDRALMVSANLVLAVGSWMLSNSSKMNSRGTLTPSSTF